VRIRIKALLRISRQKGKKKKKKKKNKKQELERRTRMSASGMRRCVALVKIVVSEEDGGDTFLRNVGFHKTYTVTHPTRLHYS
jgi:hypothetical protein